MLYVILCVIAVLATAVALVFAIAAMKPNTFVIQRSIVIHSPPQPIFDVLSDFHQSTHWSPWDKLDPHATMTISGAPRGVGAIFEWDGNQKVGKGRQEILEVDPPTSVRIKIDFFRPFQAQNSVEFTMTPEGPSTRVHWAMSGPQPLVGRVMCLFVNMDKMVGKDFEKGLSNLKGYLEGPR